MATDASILAGRYRLDAPDADVGLYDTWRATDLTRDLPVRVERLPRPLAADLAEHLRSLRALSDVGLVPALDGGLEGEGAFLVTGRDDGQRSLAHWLAGHRAAATLPSPATVQRLFDRVGAALRFVHESRGPLRAHGGLAARTVLLRRVGPQHAVRLFGLGALHLVAPVDASAAWERVAPYLPPAYPFGAPASTDHDLFALAVLHVELLTARATATPTETWGEAARDGAHRVRALLREARDDVPAPLVDVLARALSAAPRERFPSAAALTKAVRDAWTAADGWAPPGAADPEPPLPEDRAPSGVAPSRAATSAVPVGWQVAERAPPAAARDDAPPPLADPLDDRADPTEAVATALDLEDDDEATRASARPAEVAALATAMLGAESPFGGSAAATSPVGDPFATERVSAREVAAAHASLPVAADTERVDAREVEAVRASLAASIEPLHGAPPEDAPTAPVALVPAPGVVLPARAPAPPATPPPPPPAPPRPVSPVAAEPLALGPIVAATVASLLLVALALAWTLR